jgi:hypothetical protein
MNATIRSTILLFILALVLMPRVITAASISPTKVLRDQAEGVDVSSSQQAVKAERGYPLT